MVRKVLSFSQENKKSLFIHVCMAYILFRYIWTILLYIVYQEMKCFLRFEVTLNIQRQGLTISLHEKQSYFPNNPIADFFRLKEIIFVCFNSNLS